MKSIITIEVRVADLVAHQMESRFFKKPTHLEYTNRILGRKTKTPNANKVKITLKARVLMKNGAKY